ncbi:hypothetical protein DRE_06543 [Drechslerella stenobrocha 248]|uniref:Ricin B lectin domain-containing protein n=1 Tax=Drechslerella stenobrocha 248 TaxID=1043628 RepID=W7I729_9PEZI|nr:hypothetical protein DRE_06543 [Drechslerella stenobrocha 248]
MKVRAAFAGAVLLAPAAHAELSKIVRVDVASQQYIDAEGRSRHFHGTNMVNKKFPFHKDVTTFIPGRSLVDHDIQILKSMNVNLVRLGVHWAGVEPVRGQYNQTYLDITAGIIKKLQENDIYTIVDQHQDVWGAQICGHGAPDWFVKPNWVAPAFKMPFPQKLPFKVDANGMPSEADCKSIDWGTSYLNVAVGDAFGRLYSNFEGLGDMWAAYWRVLAERYGSMPGVMGYDLMNEPWVGNHIANPLLLVPGVADRVSMEPLWNKGNDAIRSVDDTTIVMFEGATLDILAGFTNVPGGDGSKTAHSYHFYNPPQLGGIEATIKNRIKDNNRLKTTGMLTEFMLWEQTESGLASSLEVVRKADKYLQSWTSWAYEELFLPTAGADHWGPAAFGTKSWGTSGSGPVAPLPAGSTIGITEPFPVLAIIQARTYAEATAGTTKSSHFEDATGKYWVSWTVDTSITAPGLVRIAPNWFYPDGIRVLTDPPGLLAHTMESENVVQLRYTDAAKGQNGRTVMASLQPFYPTGAITNGVVPAGKCVEVEKGSVSPYSPVILRTCASRWNQTWKFRDGAIQIAFDESRATGKYCLDTLPIAGKSYLGVVLNPCRDAAPSQQWNVTSAKNIVNVASGFCLDIEASRVRDGTRLLAFPCGKGQKNQLWTAPDGVDNVWKATR